MNNELAARVANDPELQARMKIDPVSTLQNLTTPLQTDVWIYRMVAGSLSLVVLISIIGSMYLANTQNGVPDVALALGSAAIGALAGLLAPPPR